MKKTPMRKCVVTNERFPKNELIRVVKTPEGNVEVDTSGKKNGRGAYLKLSLEVIEMAQKKKSLAKALETEIPNEVYEELKDLID